MEIEFTDRYGGRMPSWLRGCHGDCEATGAVPLYEATEPPLTTASREDVAWERAHAAAGEHECDGCHFVECFDCGGSGRVSWFVTAARIPRWLVKGARFMAMVLTHENYWLPGTTPRERLRVAFNAAYGADIKALLR